MIHNPPCKECLVRSMCLFSYGNSYPPSPPWDVKSWNLRSKLCNILFEFLINNKAFGMPESKKALKRIEAKVIIPIW
jgi:hypothetical protein